MPFQVLIHLHVKMKNMSKKSEQSKTKVQFSFSSSFSPSSFLHFRLLLEPGASPEIRLRKSEKAVGSVLVHWWRWRWRQRRWLPSAGLISVKMKMVSRLKVMSQSRQLEAPAVTVDSVQTSSGSRSGVSLVSGAKKYLDRSSENRFFFRPVRCVRRFELLLFSNVLRNRKFYEDGEETVLITHFMGFQDRKSWSLLWCQSSSR